MREKTEFLHIRVSKSEKIKIEKLSASKGKTVSGFIRDVISRMEPRSDGDE